MMASALAASPQLASMKRQRWQEATRRRMRKAVSVAAAIDGAGKVPALVRSENAGRKNRAAQLWGDAKLAGRRFMEDVKEWGIGAEPIFTVVVSDDGKLQVSVDEEEIQGRCGLHSMISRGDKLLLSEQIQKARKLAADVENGLYTPPPMSTLYRFVKAERAEAPPVANAYKQHNLIAAGLAFGVVLALCNSAFRAFKKKRQVPKAPQDMTLLGEDVSAPRKQEPLELSDRVLKIREMAQEATVAEKIIDEEEAGDIPEPLQYASLMRSHLRQRHEEAKMSDEISVQDTTAKKIEEVLLERVREKEWNKKDADLIEGSRIIELAQRLDDVRRAGEPNELLAGPSTKADSAQDKFGGTEEHILSNTNADTFRSHINGSAVTFQADKPPDGHESETAQKLELSSDISSISRQPLRDSDASVATSSIMEEHLQVKCTLNGTGEEVVDPETQVEAPNVEPGNLEPEYSAGTPNFENSAGTANAEQVKKDGATPTRKGRTSNSAKPASGRKSKPRVVTSYAEAAEILASNKKRGNRRRKNGSVSPTEEQASRSRSAGPRNGASPTKSAGSIKQSSESLPVVDVYAKGAAGNENGIHADKILQDSSPEASKLKPNATPDEAKLSLLDEGKLSAKTHQSATSAVKKYISEKSAVEKPIEDKPQQAIVTGSGSYSNVDPRSKKKVWPKDIQRRYDRETDPQARALLREIGSDLDKWIPEEKIDEDVRLYNQGTEGRQELLRRWYNEWLEAAKEQAGDDIDEEEIAEVYKKYEKIEERVRKQTEMFGPQALANKYRSYNPKKPDYLWWFELRYVACVALQDDKNNVNTGFYSLDMATEKENKSMPHVIGFEEQNDALNFCRIMVPVLKQLGGYVDAMIIPFEPKELFREATAMGYKVTVIRKGQLELVAGKPFEEVEDRILELGRDYYVQERIRANSIDLNAVMEDLSRGL